jgi:hypothetical protein
MLETPQLTCPFWANRNLKPEYGNCGIFLFDFCQKLGGVGGHPLPTPLRKTDRSSSRQEEFYRKIYLLD